ncbi:DUF4919 domain-containing protein [Aliikangiella sp. IMCC44653]
MKQEFSVVFCFLIITSCLMVTGCARKSTAPTQTHYTWQDSPNFYQLRKQLGWQANFSALCESNRPLNTIVLAMNEENWIEASLIGAEWLQQCPVDMVVHYYTAVCLEQLGQSEDASHHYRWSKGLMNSIVATGDGRTATTAYETISVSEEYDVLYFFDLEQKSQALVRGEVLLDLIVATNQQGEEFSIYFNPAAHFYRLSKMGQN